MAVQTASRPGVVPGRAEGRSAEAVWPFLVAGGISIILGGLVSAVSRPLAWDLGSWAAAYLVLVGGVAQIGLGGGQAWIADDAPDPVTAYGQVALWNLSVMATLAASLLGVPALTTVSGVATVAALAWFLIATRRVRPGPRWSAWVFRTVVGVVLVSTPVGVALSWIRHG